MATLFGARLATHLQKTLKMTELATLWSDNQIVLHWLSTTKPQEVRVESCIRNKDNNRTRIMEVFPCTRQPCISPDMWHQSAEVREQRLVVYRTVLHLQSEQVTYIGTKWRYFIDDSWRTGPGFTKILMFLLMRWLSFELKFVYKLNWKRPFKLFHENT